MLTYEDKVDLCYLIHDKKHITSGGRVQAIDNAVLYEGEENNLPLYRGVSEKELNDILNGIELNRYQSFSELKDIAKQFGPYVITILPSNIKSFPLWRWAVKDLCILKSEDIEQYMSTDGDNLQILYADEREWIIPYGTKLKLVDRDKLIFKIIL